MSFSRCFRSDHPRTRSRRRASTSPTWRPGPVRSSRMTSSRDRQVRDLEAEARSISRWKRASTAAWFAVPPRPGGRARPESARRSFQSAEALRPDARQHPAHGGRRSTPAVVPVVLGDQQRDALGLAPGKLQPPARCRSPAGRRALVIVEGVLAGPPSLGAALRGFATIVQQRREAHDQVGRRGIHAAESMPPHVPAVIAILAKFTDSSSSGTMWARSPERSSSAGRGSAAAPRTSSFDQLVAHRSTRPSEHVQRLRDASRVGGRARTERGSESPARSGRSRLAKACQGIADGRAGAAASPRTENGSRSTPAIGSQAIAFTVKSRRGQVSLDVGEEGDGARAPSVEVAALAAKRVTSTLCSPESTVTVPSAFPWE